MANLAHPGAGSGLAHPGQPNSGGSSDPWTALPPISDWTIESDPNGLISDRGADWIDIADVSITVGDETDYAYLSTPITWIEAGALLARLTTSDASWPAEATLGIGISADPGGASADPQSWVAVARAGSGDPYKRVINGNGSVTNGSATAGIKGCEFRAWFGSDEVQAVQHAVIDALGGAIGNPADSTGNGVQGSTGSLKLVLVVGREATGGGVVRVTVDGLHYLLTSGPA
jgi:hypothetical protein